ncbi:MAG: agmatine deiminase [Anaerolineales bacterium]|nr:agmatine deiminase [Anaerolineales bacterium]
MPTLTTTPRQDGFRMPAEFEPHTGCWMLWPQRSDNWRQGAKPAQQAFVNVAAAIRQFEPVTVGVCSEQYQNARQMLPPFVRVVEMSANDAWMRDVGPTFVINDKGDVRGVDWGFNAWGGLKGGVYFPWDQDALVAQKVLELEQVARYKAPLILEGGSIHVDGQGAAITTEECLLHSNRNPQLFKAQIEQYLKDYLNVETVIWLGRGVYNDETNGHVDNLCCFIRPGEVALTWTDDQHDPQYLISQDAYLRLQDATDARGRRLKIHKLHQPGPLYITEAESRDIDQVEGTQPRRAGNRLAASYVNFYIANGGVVMPLFGDPHDQAAQASLQALFPDRKVIGVPSREIILGGGNIHCITQQQPGGV